MGRSRTLCCFSRGGASLYQMNHVTGLMKHSPHPVANSAQTGFRGY